MLRISLSRPHFAISCSNIIKLKLIKRKTDRDRQFIKLQMEGNPHRIIPLQILFQDGKPDQSPIKTYKFGFILQFLSMAITLMVSVVI